MIFSRSLLIRAVIFAVVCVVIVGLLPTKVQIYLEGKTMEEGIDTFNYYGAISDSIFNEFTGENIPKSIEGFDFVTLKELGSDIHVNYDETIELIKKPFGSVWVIHALGLTIISLVKQLAETAVNGKISYVLYTTILSFLGILLMFILHSQLFSKKFKEKTRSNDPIKPVWISVVLCCLNIILLATLLGLITFLIVSAIPSSIQLIINPTYVYFGQIDFGITFYFTTLLYLFSLVFSFFLIVYFLRLQNTTQRKIYSLILIIPIIALGYNLWSSTKFVKSVNHIIDMQNISSNRQMITSDCCKIAYITRQWYLTNHLESGLKLEELTFPDDALPPENENGKYNYQIEDNILTITGEGKFELRNGDYPLLITTYNAKTDSIRTRLIR